MPKTPKYVPKKLDEAADLLEATGWCAGTMKDPDGSHCLVGAIHAVTRIPTADWYSDDPWRPEGRYAKVIEAAHSALPQRAQARETATASPFVQVNYLTRYNDDMKDEEGKKKVVKFLRSTATKLRERQ